MSDLLRRSFDLACSPHFTPLRLFLRGYLKSKVYNDLHINLEALVLKDFPDLTKFQKVIFLANGFG